MEQIRKQRKTGHLTEQRSKANRRRQHKQRFLIVLGITFLLGFLAGLFVGSKKVQPVNFVMESSAETSENSSDSSKDTKKNIDNSKLPWNLQLVNYEYPLEETFKPETLAEADNTYETDSRIADAVKKMISDARQTEDVRIIAISAFRDYDYQMELFEDKVQRLQKEHGYSVKKAREEAATVVAYPGTSEHQLGLALDLVDARHVKLDESQENTAAYQWLFKHCAEYGFIVRYPNGKTDITGIIYEPWHFRYVGEEAAKVIMEKNITLEEYLADYYEF